MVSLSCRPFDLRLLVTWVTNFVVVVKIGRGLLCSFLYILLLYKADMSIFAVGVFLQYFCEFIQSFSSFIHHQKTISPSVVRRSSDTHAKCEEAWCMSLESLFVVVGIWRCWISSCYAMLCYAVKVVLSRGPWSHSAPTARSSTHTIAWFCSSALLWDGILKEILGPGLNQRSLNLRPQI